MRPPAWSTIFDHLKVDMSGLLHLVSAVSHDQPIWVQKPNLVKASKQGGSKGDITILDQGSWVSSSLLFSSLLSPLLRLVVSKNACDYLLDLTAASDIQFSVESFDTETRCEDRIGERMLALISLAFRNSIATNGAPGRTTRSKSLLVTRTLLVAPGVVLFVVSARSNTFSFSAWAIQLISLLALLLSSPPYLCNPLCTCSFDGELFHMIPLFPTRHLVLGGWPNDSSLTVSSWRSRSPTD